MAFLFSGRLTSICIANVVVHVVDDEAGQTNCHCDSAERENSNQTDPLSFS